jgi:hypothetical protein
MAPGRLNSCLVGRPPTLAPVEGMLRVYDSSVSSCSSLEPLPTLISMPMAASAPTATDVRWGKQSFL